MTPKSADKISALFLHRGAVKGREYDFALKGRASCVLNGGRDDMYWDFAGRNEIFSEKNS